MSRMLPSLLLILAVITTGLYAGFMLTFLIAVMPGLATLPDEQFTAAMRRFNEKVPGPVFLCLFLGVIAFPAAVVVVGVGDGDTGRAPAIAALVCAAAGHLITIAGNIPLNSALARSEGGDDSAARTAFEAPWNRLHLLRTLLTLLAFALLAAAGAGF
ncbi:anthrone oxygenase family protein [Streptomyces sp. NPDC092952]|uniref:anthrone oxygenase family protein n=1 Tax=Streptomyces sp. NPDC092952 TaxID=3366018 RepID=UPI00382DE88C